MADQTPLNPAIGGKHYATEEVRTMQKDLARFGKNGKGAEKPAETPHFIEETPSPGVPPPVSRPITEARERAQEEKVLRRLSPEERLAFSSVERKEATPDFSTPKQPPPPPPALPYLMPAAQRGKPMHEGEEEDILFISQEKAAPLPPLKKATPPANIPPPSPPLPPPSQTWPPPVPPQSRPAVPQETFTKPRVPQKPFIAPLPSLKPLPPVAPKPQTVEPYPEQPLPKGPSRALFLLFGGALVLLFGAAAYGYWFFMLRTPTPPLPPPPPPPPKEQLLVFNEADTITITVATLEEAPQALRNAISAGAARDRLTRIRIVLEAAGEDSRKLTLDETLRALGVAMPETITGKIDHAHFDLFLFGEAQGTRLIFAAKTQTPQELYAALTAWEPSAVTDFFPLLQFLSPSAAAQTAIFSSSSWASYTYRFVRTPDATIGIAYIVTGSTVIIGTSRDSFRAALDALPQ